MTYTGLIQQLPENGIWVFGSNPEGRHGAGTALIAAKKYGAKYGNGYGLMGRSYGIVTKDLRKINHPSVPPKEIERQIKELYNYAKTVNNNFFIAYTANGQNLNGYTARQMAKMFSCAPIPDNIVFEDKFEKLVLENKHFNDCIVTGETTEEELGLYLAENKWYVKYSDGNNPYYDLLISEDEKFINPLKIEVKTDIKANETGNIAVEMSKKIRGVEKSSGLSITQSDFYVYKIKGDEAFYFIETEKLKELCASDKIKRKTIGGDRDSVNLVLIDKNIFCQHCRKI